MSVYIYSVYVCVHMYIHVCIYMYVHYCKYNCIITLNKVYLLYPICFFPNNCIFNTSETGSTLLCSSRLESSAKINACSTEETFQYFPEILKRSLQDLWKILKKYFLAIGSIL